MDGLKTSAGAKKADRRLGFPHLGLGICWRCAGAPETPRGVRYLSMIRFSRASGLASAPDPESTEDRVAAGPVAKAHAGVTARIACHTFLPSLIGSASVVLYIGANQGQFTRSMVRD